MPMKITIVNGENHKGSTYHIARQIADKIAALMPRSEITEIWLPRDLPEFCLGCAKCVTDSETLCPHYRYMQPLTEKVDEADVLILESPVYVYHCSGLMKNFLDHYAYRWMLHRPESSKFTRQAICVATAAGGGMRKTTDDMRDSMRWWGFSRIYCYGKAVASIGWTGVSEKKKREIDAATTRLAQKAVRGYGRVCAGVGERAKFMFIRMFQKRGWNKADAVYWRQEGWLDEKRPWKPSEKHKTGQG